MLSPVAVSSSPSSDIPSVCLVARRRSNFWIFCRLRCSLSFSISCFCLCRRILVWSLSSLGSSGRYCSSERVPLLSLLVTSVVLTDSRVVSSGMDCNVASSRSWGWCWWDLEDWSAGPQDLVSETSEDGGPLAVFEASVLNVTPRDGLVGSLASRLDR